MLAAARRLPAALALLAALCAAAPALAFEEKDPASEPIEWGVTGPKVFDAVVLRPLGAGATVAGAAAFVIAAPLAWYSVGIDGVWDIFVMEPVDFTFVRPLGDF